MKWTIIILNLIAAAAFIFLGSVAAAIHRVHSYSTYVEFVSVGAVDEQRLQTLARPGAPKGTGYDMPARMRQIGNAEAWFRDISGLAGIACILNAVGVYFLPRGDRRR